ncbi:MAG: ATP-dependent helicase [Thermaerobacter sp.]|nr:ATP-dependent helicase [Thermaerobacter sp.]
MTRRYTLEQEEVISFGEGALLVVAGPGTGKTAVLTQRIVRILRASPEDTYRVLALTFTNKAAHEMQDRVRAELNGADQRAWIGTFHGFALDVLQRHGEHIGLAANLVVLDREDDRQELLAATLRDRGYVQPIPARELRQLVFEIGRMKRELLAPAMGAGRVVAGVEVRTAYAAYDAELRAQNLVDFDDLLVLGQKLFQEAPRVAAHYRDVYRFIMIDEAQDTNRAQYHLLKALCGGKFRNVMMVGDGWQHLYGFTGASHRYMELFKQDFHAAELHLNKNFRCASSIVDLSNRLLTQDTGSILARTAQVKEPVGEVKFQEFPDEGAEARWIADGIQRFLDVGLEGEPLASANLAVMARNRYLLEPCRQELVSRRVPCALYAEKKDFLASEQGSLLRLALQVLYNPRDLLHLENLAIGVGIGQRQVEQMVDDAPWHAAPLLQRLAGETRQPPWPQLLGRLADTAAAGKAQRVAEYLPLLLESLERDAGPQEAELVQRDGSMLRERLSALRVGSDAGPDLAEFLGSLAFDGADQGQGVRLLTVHAAKGLEFQVVWLLGMNQGSFPDYRSLNSPERLAEERRACYVAVTRACRGLFISRPRRRLMPWGEIKDQPPSQFLAEMGQAAERGYPLGAAEGPAPWP